MKMRVQTQVVRYDLPCERSIGEWKAISLIPSRTIPGSCSALRSHPRRAQPSFWVDHAFHVGVLDVRRSTGLFLIQAPCDATQVEDVAEDPPW